MAMSIYKKAAKVKLRFDHKGQLSAEDLWDLQLEALDEIYKKLTRQRREDSGDSLLRKETNKKSTLDLKIEIVKDVVNTKLEASQANEKRAQSKARKQKILEIIEAKQAEELSSMSTEELRRLAEEDDVE